MALSVNSITFIKSIGTSTGAADTKSLLPPFEFAAMPVLDVQTTDLICRTPDMTSAITPFPIGAGETLRVTWDVSSKSPYSGSDPVGPCVFWLAPYSSKGIGKVWTKIHHYMYDGDDKSANWCSAKLVDNGGYYDLVIPKDIVNGQYYLRSELIDITGARLTSNYLDSTAGPRFHVNCAVIDVTGGSGVPFKAPVSILDVYKPFYKKTVFPTAMVNSKLILPGPAPLTDGSPKK
ncbi:hypothetical protein FBU31_003603 [Coemansia sp. 'formosensis']|nr:hypothetical protein FBU31_003603 [Coemansia sp. 'formosensis']